jgi:hypothetical protein
VPRSVTIPPFALTSMSLAPMSSSR